MITSKMCTKFTTIRWLGPVLGRVVGLKKGKSSSERVRSKAPNGMGGDEACKVEVPSPQAVGYCDELSIEVEFKEAQEMTFVIDLIYFFFFFCFPSR